VITIFIFTEKGDQSDQGEVVFPSRLNGSSGENFKLVFIHI